jgi:Ca-activated chloride channel family protein
MNREWQTPQSPRSTGQSFNVNNCLIVVAVLLAVVCMCVVLTTLAGNSLWDTITAQFEPDEPTPPASWSADSAELTVAVSPGMAPVLGELAEQFNGQGQSTPGGQTMQVKTLALAPEVMVEQSLSAPSFQALAPDSSLWLNQLEQRWSERQDAGESEEGLVPIGDRRISNPARYATSPIVIAAWESVARELGWPERAIGWQQIQRQATDDPNFKWNHPSTSHASGLLATLAEFYAGAGLTRGLTPEAATDPQTLEYVRAVEATVRFYGEGEQVIVERLAAEGRTFLDAFVAQEQVVVAWNQRQAVSERLVAIYPAEGTLWADHPIALLELGGPGETPITDNQRRTYHAFVQFLSTPDVQRQLLAAGYRPADLSISLDEAGSVFANDDAVDWRQPQTTLQIPSAAVVEVVQNVWWYTKRPTNVYLVVDTSGSMQGAKLERTQEALKAFVAQIQGDRDQVGLIEFGSAVKLFEPLRPLDDENRRDLIAQIDAMEADAQTAMIDAVIRAYDALQDAGDTEAINAIVVMTDGRENASSRDAVDLQRRFEREDAVPVVVFAVAFGDDADGNLLQKIADIGNGQLRWADETDIEELYKIISTYF